ncbi:MAG: extracellular solute-binding protein [Gammaproteobacteria bacterium]|jgi:ABC-type Fe3+ transport system substrate-binding protein|nr:extracellular solute-binding protein [Gammaproteobacteria bacterium]MBT3725381.1 extracellular solute-binding protein [Gammaproteobacteria bacterium]MBT4195151.1 extracellular solute-binding protein [Gammaproteobacteria bacterium]MBT4448281.1 extracellular solute-binding protein [Gammaproteobacteria bacterium]MBT6454246.1 extracellular solute-binding protein [Gammaproteobacteria bacterium]
MQSLLRLVLIISSVIFNFCWAVTDSSPDNKLNILTSFPPAFYQPFQQLFSQLHPEIELNIRNKKTTAGLSYLQRQTDHHIDIFWASAPDAFDILDQAELLEEIKDTPFPFPTELHGYPLKDIENHYLGFALSGYGIIFNQQYARQHQLPAPQSWKDLTNPLYHSHLALSSPSRSGTTHLMIEMILQHYGWNEGWKIILQMAGNAATITARSYGVPEGVQQGRFGLGLTIDFLSRRISNDEIEFIYANETRFLPASIALLKTSSNKSNANLFIQFLLSRQGQELLQTRKISRLPINPQLYADNKSPLNPYSLKPANFLKTFSATESRQRYQLVNTLFDHFITFQLSTLQRIWKKVIEAEKILNDNIESKNKWQSQLEAIRDQLTTIPLNAEQINNVITLRKSKPLNSNFSTPGFLPSTLTPLKSTWLSTLVDAEKSLQEILTDTLQVKTSVHIN